MIKIKQRLLKTAAWLLILSLLPTCILTSVASGLRYLIEPTDVYERVYNFHDGLALAVKDGQIGYINKQNESVIPFGKYVPKFNSPWEYDFNGGAAVVSDGEKYGIIDTSGNVIVPVEYGYIGIFHDGLFRVEENEQCGILNNKGEFVVNMGIYDQINWFDNGYAVVVKDGKYGAVNSGLELIIPLIYDYLYINTGSETVNFIAMINGEQGIVNQNGEFSAFIDGESQSLYFSEKYRKDYSSENKKYRFVDRVTNEPVTDFLYSYIYGLKNGKAIAVMKKNDSYKNGVIDENLNVVLPFEYNTVFSTGDEKMFYTCSIYFNEYEVRDENLNVFLPFKCRGANVRDGLLYVQSLNYDLGVFDFSGNTIIPFGYGFDFSIYTYPTFSEGVIWVKKGDKWGLAEYTGNGFCDIMDKPVEMTEAIEFLNEKGIIAGMNAAEFAPDESLTRAQTAAIILRMLGKEPQGGGTNEFPDVSPSDWYYNIAAAAKNEGIISGFPDGTFQGNLEIKKEQLVAICARILRDNGFSADESDKMNYSGKISDWVLEDVLLAKSTGIITESGMFNGTKNINRGDASVIIKRLYDKLYH